MKYFYNEEDRVVKMGSLTKQSPFPNVEILFVPQQESRMGEEGLNVPLL